MLALDEVVGTLSEVEDWIEGFIANRFITRCEKIAFSILNTELYGHMRCVFARPDHIEGLGPDSFQVDRCRTYFESGAACLEALHFLAYREWRLFGWLMHS